MTNNKCELYLNTDFSVFLQGEILNVLKTSSKFLLNDSDEYCAVSFVSFDSPHTAFTDEQMSVCKANVFI